IDERLAADGRVLRAPDPAAVRTQLQRAREDGVAALAICLLHGAAHPRHEQRVAEIARAIGFDEISVSTDVAPHGRLVPRAETTVVDASLGPVLRGYVAELSRPLAPGSLRVMSSAGGLVDAARFTGKDSVLSGPAGGVVGVARAAAAAGFTRAIGL